MKFLLDTHVWLWLQTEPGRVRADVRDQLASEASQVFLSSASAWEIAVKYALGKLPLPQPPRDYVPSRMRRDAIDGLSVTHAHALQVATLPLHHSDPFDRLLIAQAQLENITLVTVDPQVERYDVPLLPAV